MKTIILAAGYATRMYPVTENFPKPLLEIGRISILDRLLKDIDTLDEIDHHLIVTNHKYLPHFERWLKESHYTKRITLIDDGTIDNENRLGAIKDLLLAIEAEHLDDDLLVIAADNIVTFSFRGFLDFFKAQQTSLIMTCHEPSLEALKRTGVATIDSEFQVLEMQEKPQLPKSNLAVPPFYIYIKEDIKHILSCIAEGCPPDAPGHLVISMLSKTKFHAWPMPSPRIDIGTLETYYEQVNSPFEAMSADRQDRQGSRGMY